MKYSPKSEMDYGVVACWASNTVGNQKEPCLFHVVPAGNASVFNGKMMKFSTKIAVCVYGRIRRILRIRDTCRLTAHNVATLTVTLTIHCAFDVSLTSTGKPVAPANCSVHNQTADSVRVDCQEAFDGGLQQTFGLELIDRDTRTLRYALNNSRPTFTVYGLEPETAFLLHIFALNAKGRSHEITLEATTLRTAEKHTGDCN